MDAAAYSAQPFVQTILRHVTPGARLLDAGCGTGGLLWFFRERGLDVAGVDTSQAALEAARRMVPGAVVEAASIEALPFQGASFDAYLAIGSWEYPPEGPVAAAREAARALKPGGLAFIEVPHANLSRRLFYIPLKRLQHFVHPSEVCKTLFGRVRARTPQFSHHLFRIREMHDVLRRAGFDILETRPHDLPEPTRHYGLWVDWPFLRGRPRWGQAPFPENGPSRGARQKRCLTPYELNALGRIVKRFLNALSPWTISTGMFIVARKK